ncbi:MAG TPA: YbaK/EbsC family protein [Methylomirabilota bacterium]|nr:YbaK/EbsC family protein [Methylomirabilota bacterium]
MLMPRRLESHLNAKHIQFSMIYHAPTDSAQMAASAMHLPGKEVAKAVALQAGDREILAVLPASYRINFEKLSAIAGAEVRLMDEEAYSELFPDCERGVIPAFGELYGVPVYLDEALAEDPEIILSAGTYHDSVRMGNVDFVHLAEPLVCSFAEKS